MTAGRSLGLTKSYSTSCVASLISALAHPAALLDGSGRILACNTGFRDWLGPENRADDRNDDETDDTACDRPGTVLDLLSDRAAADCRDALATPDGRAVQFDGLLGPGQLSFTAFTGDAGHNSDVILCQISRLASADTARLAYLMDHLDHGVWDYHVSQGRFSVSQAWLALRGYGPRDREPTDPDGDWSLRIHPDDRELVTSSFGRQTRGEQDEMNIQYRAPHAQGHWVWIHCRSKVVVRNASGRPERIVGTDADITALKQQDQERVELANKLQLAIKASGVGVWEFNPVTNEVHWDDRMLEIYGVTDGQNLRHGNLWETHLHPDDLAGTVAYSDYCQEHGLDFQRDYRIVRPDGTIRYIRSLAANIAARKLQGRLIGVNIDITEDRERQAALEAVRAQLEHDSRHDALTGLANRRLLDERTAALFDGATSSCAYAVLHLDLDRFKQINDALGHNAGDAVLVHVADTLRTIIGDAGLPCRTGGDEFVVLFEKAPSTASLRAISDALLEAFAEPFLYKGAACHFGVSIGAALGHGQPATASEIFTQADAALYAAKEAGRSCFRLFENTQPRA